jgi:hypothetical protein
MVVPGEQAGRRLCVHSAVWRDRRPKANQPCHHHVDSDRSETVLAPPDRLGLAAVPDKYAAS